MKNMKKRKNFTFGADQLIKDYLQILLIKCLRLLNTPKESLAQKHTPTEKTLIYEVKQYLEENYHQKITLEELCFLFNTNKTSLSVKFKQTFHQTIIDYLNTLRIEHTKSLLREGTYTLTQIADSMNMSSVHYLTTLFKKITNMTPTEYVHTLKETLQG